MGKLFGTDGIRGIAGQTLTAELAFHVGQAVAAVLTEKKGSRPLVTIGKDTRISSDMLEAALMAGICSVGGDVMPLGTIPTPAVAFLTVQQRADAGIVISASHNPYAYNGIKVFNGQGYKLSDEMEEQVERLILDHVRLQPAADSAVGRRHHGMHALQSAYIRHLLGSIDCDLTGLRLLNLLSLHGASPEQIEGGILGSVVPALTGRVLAALQMLCPVRILTVGPGLKSGIRLRLDNPAQLGAELLCGAVAALAEGSGPLVVISADTAISLMAVNGKQELVGGVILPGPQLSLAALVQNTAQLPQIDLSAPAPASVLGKNTAACLQNGFVLGTAGMLDGLADHFCAELGPETKFYATGNLPTAIRDACRTPILYRETLITDGLYCIWLRNRR